MHLVNLFHIATAHAAADLNSQVESELGSKSGFYIKLMPVLNSGWTVGNIVDTVLNIIFYAGGVVAVIYLIWGGLAYITSAGDESKASKARGTIINAVIGIVIILLAVAIQTAASRIFKGSSSTSSTSTSDTINL